MGGGEIINCILGADCTDYLFLHDLNRTVTRVGEHAAEIVMQRIPYGRIQCRVYDATSGDTLRNAAVYFVKSDVEADKVLSAKEEQGKSVKPSFFSGWSTLDNVPAGDATLLAQADGYGIQLKGGIVVEKGKTTQVVWDANTAAERNKSELIIDMEALEYSKCFFSVVQEDESKGERARQWPHFLFLLMPCRFLCTSFLQTETIDIPVAIKQK